jgi:hypothetical protein
MLKYDGIREICMVTSEGEGGVLCLTRRLANKAPFLNPNLVHGFSAVTLCARCPRDRKNHLPTSRIYPLAYSGSRRRILTYTAAVNIVQRLLYPAVELLAYSAVELCPSIYFSPSLLLCGDLSRNEGAPPHSRTTAAV